ncbi:DUF177 domain-containing protein [Irregularibacter muris]|uniref:DUF177 domain-containing protein n=1 Tax=Irregularibacter muris TaxID=1796619 RepID=A0AAE3HEW2_9FIRM|nr:DUF177 domain-containing protein [Irregularibacter muris]MCR1898149.1 DUF177 domain-containing protein [Irregularibacter muris]
MIIDFSKLIKEEERHINFKDQVEVKEISDKNENIIFVSPLEVVGEGYLEEDTLVLQGNAESKVELSCGRCLEKFIYPLEFSFEEKISVSDKSFFITSGKIDFSSILWENIILNLPLQAICSEECKGICPKCGKNLNIEKCYCEDEDIDPRLVLLKDLFDEE